LASVFIILLIAVKWPCFVTKIPPLSFSIKKQGFSALKSTLSYPGDFKMWRKNRKEERLTEKMTKRKKMK